MRAVVSGYAIWLGERRQNAGQFAFRLLAACSSDGISRSADSSLNLAGLSQPDRLRA
jgi:hypothetical protein